MDPVPIRRPLTDTGPFHNWQVVVNAIGLLQEMIDHKEKARTWEEGLYPISVGGGVRLDRPHLNSPHVQALIGAGLVSYIPASSNPNIPDGVLRILNQNIEYAKALVMRYVAGLPKAKP